MTNIFTSDLMTSSTHVLALSDSGSTDIEWERVCSSTIPENAEIVILRMQTESKKSMSEERAIRLLQSAARRERHSHGLPITTQMLLDISDVETLFCTREIWTTICAAVRGSFNPKTVSEVFAKFNERHPCDAIVLR